MWVKICGVTRLEDAEECVAAGADAVGLNFVSDSPRRVEPDDRGARVEPGGRAARVERASRGSPAAG